MINFSVRQFVHLHFGVSSTEIYFVSLVVSCFLDSLCALKSWHCALCIWRSHHPPVVTSWLWETKKSGTSQPSSSSERLSDLSCGCVDSIPLTPSQWERLGLYAFSQSCKASMNVESLLFISPNVVPWSVQSCAPSLVEEVPASCWHRVRQVVGDSGAPSAGECGFWL